MKAFSWTEDLFVVSRASPSNNYYISKITVTGYLVLSRYAVESFAVCRCKKFSFWKFNSTHYFLDCLIAAVREVKMHD